MLAWASQDNYLRTQKEDVDFRVDAYAHQATERLQVQARESEAGRKNDQLTRAYDQKKAKMVWATPADRH